MTEAQWSSKLKKQLLLQLPGVVVFKLNDRKAGVPDMVITWNGHTTWFEVKRFPGFEQRPLQHLTLTRLHKAGRAFYLIFDEVQNRVAIVTPSNLLSWRSDSVVEGPTDRTFTAVLNFIRGTHGDHVEP